MSRLICKKLCTVCMAVVLLLTSYGCGTKKVEGNEWLEIQSACLSDLEAFSAGMDEVYSLYFMGAIDVEDFKAELMVLQKQYSALLQLYSQLQEENPVKEGSHSYLSKRGTEAIEKSYALLGELLINSQRENKILPADELAYTYMAYRQNLAGCIAEYVTAYQLLQEAKLMETTETRTALTD